MAGILFVIEQLNSANKFVYSNYNETSVSSTVEASNGLKLT